jgi:hypothetical protein
MDSQQLLYLLTQMGMKTDGLTPDNLMSKLSEKVTLKKFEGDQTDSEPVETLVFVDGELVERTTGGTNGTN